MNDKTIVWFFALAFAGTWALQLTFIALGLPMMSPLGMLLLTSAAVVPSAVAVILSRREGGRDAVRALWGPPGRARAAWVGLALGTPLAMKLVAAALLVAAGMPIPGVALSALTLGRLLITSLGEELGWRGFAYRRLLASMSSVRASILVGVLWGLWHLPTAFFYAAPSALGFSLFVIQVTAASVIIAWLMERAGQRTIIAIAFHAGNYLTLLHLPPTIAVTSVRTAVWVAAAVLAGVALRPRGRLRCHEERCPTNE